MNRSQLQDRIVQWTRNLSVRTGGRNPNDDAKFVELFNSIYARKVGTDYFRWRFCSSESQGTVFLALAQEMLRGACGYHLFTMSGSSLVANALIVDMMVDAKHQGKGLIFARLSLEVENAAFGDEAKCLYMFPNRSGSAAFLADKSWCQVTQMVTCVCETHSGQWDTRLDFREAQKFEPWVNGITESFQRNHQMLTFVRRDTRFLNWRFTANPLYKYSVYLAYMNDRPFAYLTLKVFRDPQTGDVFGDIVDILWSEDDPNAIAGILRFALSHFATWGIKQTTMWLQTNTILDQIGRDLGFIETEQRRDFCCKVLDANYGWLKDARRWFVTMADSEIY